MNKLRNKVALISGAASGLGAAFARGIVAEGGSVVIADIDVPGADALAADLGPRAVATPLDVTQPEDWDRAVAFTERQFGALNVLVNNAGILTAQPVEAIDDSTWDRVVDVNLKGVFLGTRAALPALRRAAPASIVNIGSAEGVRGMAGMSAYSATKFAVRGFTKSVALELAPERVRVNAVHPGFVRSAMTEGLGAPMPAEDDDNPLTRAARPDEITALVVYLAGDESQFATGGDFVIDGGITAGQPFGG